MALVVDVEKFCILKAKVGGHRRERCPQCSALTALAIEVNNMTLDMILEKFEHVKEGEKLDAVKVAKAIQNLKTPIPG